LYSIKDKLLIISPSVAIVILNWNGRSFLEKFLPFTTASTYNNYSIIVADNASDDDSVDFITKNYPGIKILLSRANQGFSKGYNSSLMQVSADYYVLLNSDVAVTKNWIEPVIALMESDEKIAACQPKILSFNNRSQFEYAGACGGFLDKMGYPFTRGRIFDTCENDTGQYDSIAKIFWASGAALFVRGTVFHEMNGFDEYFFAHQEEIDLCWRMQRAGYTIYAVPSSVVYHVGGGTLPMGDRKKIYLNFRNNLVMLSKNSTFSESLWKIPVRIMMDIVAAYRALIGGDFSTFISIASAHLDYAGWIFIGKRGKKLPKMKTKSIATVYDGSIAWQYFIKKKKTFSEIVPFKK